MTSSDQISNGNADALRLKRLRYRSWHRGFKEADLILGNFADQHLHTLDPDQLDKYEALLGEQCHDLYNWIIGKTPVPPKHDHDVMQLLQSLQYFAKTLWQTRAGRAGS